MFSALLGTPKGATKTAKNSLEFTPIGNPSTRNPEPSVSVENKENEAPSRTLNHGKITNKHMMDSSFDNTMDHFSPTATHSFVQQSQIPRLNQQKQSQNHSISVHQQQHKDYASLIAGGNTSIKEQQKQFEKLETENYNLKIKLATLTRYFDQSPEEQKQLINQNIDLKQQLMEAAKQLDQLNLDLAEYRSQASHQTDTGEEIEEIEAKYRQFLHEKDQQLREYSDKIEDMERGFEDEIETIKLRYKDMLQEKDAELQDYDHKFNDLQQQLSAAHVPTVPESVQEKMKELEWENQKLKSLLSDSKDDGEELEGVNYKLKSEFSQLHNNLGARERDLEAAKQDLEATTHEAAQFRNEASRWKNLYNNLVNENRGASVSSDDYTHAKEEIIILKAKLDELDYKYQTAKAQLEKSRQEVQDIVSQQYDGKYSHEKLQRQVEYMAKEVEDHKVIESRLREQIDSLVNEKPNLPPENYHFYEAQLEALSSRENKLTDINKKLNAQIAELKDEIYHLSTSSTNTDSHVQSLQRKNHELSEKLSYYEEEYDKLESAKKSAERSVEELQARFSRLDSDYRGLEQDNIALVNQIRDQTKNSNSAVDELETFNRKKMEMENHAMTQELEMLSSELDKLKRDLEFERAANNTEELQYEIRKLKRELELSRDNEKVEYLESEAKRLRDELAFEREKSRAQLPSSNIEYRNMSGGNERFLENEYHRISRERDQLQLNLDESINRLRDMENKYKRMQFSLQDKETLIDDMQLKLRDMKRANKFESLEDDDEKAQLMKLKASNESRIKVLELEKQSLQQEFDMKTQSYKNQIEQLQKDISSSGNNQTNNASSSIVSLLEKQLEDVKKSKQELTEQLVESTKKQTELKAQLESSNKHSAPLQELNKTFKDNETLLKQQNEQLQLKNKSLTEELDKVTDHCHKLVTKLTDLRARSQPESDIGYLQKRIDDLNQKMSQTHISSPTPTSRNGNMRVLYLEDQLKYYKAKLYDINLRSNDLELMYSFVINSVKNSNKLLRNDMAELSKLGIYPDYKSSPKKLTFSVVARFVLSMVRLKRRKEKADKRKRAIYELKNDIDKKKIILLD